MHVIQGSIKAVKIIFKLPLISIMNRAGAPGNARGAVSPPEHKDGMTCWGQRPFWPETEGVKDDKQLQVLTKKEIADCKIISSIYHHN